jgi:hypothetical protein
MHRRIVIFFFLSVLLTAGCTLGETGKREDLSGKIAMKDLPTNQSSLESTEAAKALWIAEDVRGVDEAVVVMIDEELSVAVKASNFQRLRLHKIRQEVHRRVSRSFPTYQVRVTSDNKLFSELEKILEEMKPPLSVKERQPLKKKLEKINKDMGG